MFLLKFDESNEIQFQSTSVQTFDRDEKQEKLIQNSNFNILEKAQRKKRDAP